MHKCGPVMQCSALQNPGVITLDGLTLHAATSNELVSDSLHTEAGDARDDVALCTALEHTSASLSTIFPTQLGPYLSRPFIPDNSNQYGEIYTL